MFLFLLVGCKSTVHVTCEREETIQVYAFTNDGEKLELVDIDYAIEDEVDLFELYTIYQNYLPQNYHSCASANMELLSSSVRQKVIFYEVDRFILNSPLEKLKGLLDATGKLYGYKEVHFIFNRQEII